MTNTPLPDFSKVEWQAPSLAAEAAGFAAETPEGIALKPAYGPSDAEGLDFLNTYPGLPPFLRGPYPTMYVQQPWTIRQYAGFSTAEDFQRLLPAQSRGGPEGAFGRVRSRHAPRLRQRPPARARRRGHGGRGHRLHLRHAHLVRRHPAIGHERVHDHERRGAADSGAVHRGRRGAGRCARAAFGDDPERHPERVHGAEHLHLSARRPRCASSPTSSPTRAQKMPKFNSISISGYHMQEAGATADLELAYTLADGVEYVRAGMAAGLDIDAFAPRLSFFWAIGMNYFMEVAKMRAARAALGAAHAGPRPEEPEVDEPARALPDQRLVAHRAGRVQQCHAHLHRGLGRDPWRTRNRCTPTRSTRRWRCRPTSPPASHATPSCSSNRKPAPRASSTPGAAAIMSSG